MKILEIQVKDLFKQKSYIGLDREKQWELATSQGYKFSTVHDTFRMKVIKL